MHANYLPINHEISFMLGVAMVYLATRWPYSADGVRIDTIAALYKTQEMLQEAQMTLRASLMTNDTKAHYAGLGVLASMMGDVSKKLSEITELLKDVREK